MPCFGPATAATCPGGPAYAHSAKLKAQAHPRASPLTTHEDLRLLAQRRRRQVLGDELRVDVPRRALPVRARLVDGVDDVERLRVLGLERVELLLEEDVLLGHVREDEREPRLVGRVLERVLQDLVHGRAIRARAVRQRRCKRETGDDVVRTCRCRRQSCPPRQTG